MNPLGQQTCLETFFSCRSHELFYNKTEIDKISNPVHMSSPFYELHYTPNVP